MTQADFSHGIIVSMPNCTSKKTMPPHVWAWLQRQSSDGTIIPGGCEVDRATKRNLSCCATKQEASCAAVGEETRCCDSLADPSKTALADMVQRIQLHGVVGHIWLGRTEWGRDKVPAAPPDMTAHAQLCKAVVVPVP